MGVRPAAGNVGGDRTALRLVPQPSPARHSLEAARRQLPRHAPSSLGTHPAEAFEISSFFSRWSRKGSALPAIATLIHVIGDERVKGKATSRHPYLRKCNIKSMYFAFPADREGRRRFGFHHFTTGRHRTSRKTHLERHFSLKMGGAGRNDGSRPMKDRRGPGTLVATASRRTTSHLCSDPLRRCLWS
jgi:hypothetical protein